jgi:hypothetical protein
MEADIRVVRAAVGWSEVTEVQFGNVVGNYIKIMRFYFERLHWGYFGWNLKEKVGGLQLTHGNASIKVLSLTMLNRKEDNALGTVYLEEHACGLVPRSIMSRNSHAGKWHDKGNRSALSITSSLTRLFPDVKSITAIHQSAVTGVKKSLYNTHISLWTWPQKLRVSLTLTRYQIPLSYNTKSVSKIQNYVTQKILRTKRC